MPITFEMMIEREPRFGTAGLAVVGGLTLLIAISFYISWQAAEFRMTSVARERGAALFRLIQITRSWNAQHGKVYVPVTDTTTPNKYLEHPQRDVITQEGQHLTMVNPAYMTRQISELAAQSQGIHFHITSNRPIRPENKPDEWESETLAQFEMGLSERLELQYRAPPEHRYMAPLKVEQACLKCHSKQGYELGEIRGGISVDMPAQHLLDLRSVERTHTVIGHAIAWIVTCGLSLAFIWRTRKHTRALNRINQEQERLIEDRTSSLKAANKALAKEVAQREVAAKMFQHTSQAMMVLDAELHITSANPSFLMMLRLPQDAALGKGLEAIATERQDETFYVNLASSLAQTGSWSGEFWCRPLNGETLICWLSITTVPGEPMRFVASLTDITQAKGRELHLEQLAQHDPLTGLPNRALFTDRVHMALAQAHRQHRQIAVFMLDLDHFKEINDTLGHHAGDELLREVSERLKHCIREADTVARLGGDEFAVVLTQFDTLDEVESVANRVVHTLTLSFQLAGEERHVSCSLGIAIFPSDGATMEALIQAADAAMYQVKQSGRNAYRFATPLAPND